MSEDCIFCKIVRKEVPASIVYENEAVLAFLDIRPVSEGHVLVIPKAHYETIFDTPEELLAQVYKIVKKVAEVVKKVVKVDGISIIQQNGRAADQDVFHLHVHVIPRAMGQKLHHFDKLADASRENLDKVALKIRGSLS